MKLYWKDQGLNQCPKLYIIGYYIKVEGLFSLLQKDT